MERRNAGLLRRAAVAPLLVAAGIVALPAVRDAAHATGGIECSAIGRPEISVSMILASGLVSRPLNVRLRIGDRRMSDMQGDGEPIAVAQSFFSRDRIMLDLIDQQALTRVARLRVDRIEDGRHLFQFGTLHLPGEAAYPVECEGP